MLTLPMLRLFSSKTQRFLKNMSCCNSLESSRQMSTHVSGFQSFFSCFLHHLILARLGTSSIRVKGTAGSGLHAPVYALTHLKSLRLMSAFMTEAAGIKNSWRWHTCVPALIKEGGLMLIESAV